MCERAYARALAGTRTCASGSGAECCFQSWERQSGTDWAPSVPARRGQSALWATSPRQLNSRLLLDLVRDRERDPVLLDAGVENHVVEEGGRLWFEKDPGSLLFDHLVVLSRQ
jgi:hypothetical protein